MRPMHQRTHWTKWQTGAFLFWYFLVANLLYALQTAERSYSLLKEVFVCYCMLERSTVREEAKPRQVVWKCVMMRDVLHPLREEKGGSSQCRRWDAGAVPLLAAVVQQPETKGAEINASACFLKNAYPKGTQMFFEFLFLHPCGEKRPMSRALIEKYIVSCMRESTGDRSDSKPTTEKYTLMVWNLGIPSLDPQLKENWGVY